MTPPSLFEIPVWQVRERILVALRIRPQGATAADLGGIAYLRLGISDEARGAALGDLVHEGLVAVGWTQAGPDPVYYLPEFQPRFRGRPEP